MKLRGIAANLTNLINHNTLSQGMKFLIPLNGNFFQNLYSMNYIYKHPPANIYSEHLSKTKTYDNDAGIYLGKHTAVYIYEILKSSHKYVNKFVK